MTSIPRSTAPSGATTVVSMFAPISAASCQVSEELGREFGHSNLGWAGVGLRTAGVERYPVTILWTPVVTRTPRRWRSG